MNVTDSLTVKTKASLIAVVIGFTLYALLEFAAGTFGDIVYQWAAFIAVLMATAWAGDRVEEGFRR